MHGKRRLQSHLLCPGKVKVEISYKSVVEFPKNVEDMTNRSQRATPSNHLPDIKDLHLIIAKRLRSNQI